MGARVKWRLTGWGDGWEKEEIAFRGWTEGGGHGVGGSNFLLGILLADGVK